MSISGTLNRVPATGADYRRIVEARLPHFMFDDLDDGAGEALSPDNKVADFWTIQLEQHVIRDVSDIRTCIELYGEKLIDGRA